MKMTIESTAAKRGRFTKNFEKDMRVVLERSVFEEPPPPLMGEGQGWG